MLSLNRPDRDLKRPPSDQVSDTPVKRQCQHNDLDRWVPSARFWDTLPKIYLTRRALIEQDRRIRSEDLKLQTLNKKQPFRRRSVRLQSARTKEASILPVADTKQLSLELKHFARHGGPDLTSIRGFPDPTMSDQASRPSRPVTSTGRTTSSKRSGPYDANYELKLAQVGIFVVPQKDENNQRIKPSNYNEIVDRLGKRRPSLSPSRFTEQDFENFQEQTEYEILEAETMQKSIAIIEGDGAGIYSRTGGPFNNLKPFDPELAMAVPDSYDGAAPLSFDHRILNTLNEYIVPNTDTTRPAAPNFFLEGKSRNGRADVAKRQAAHTGAIGARGMMSLQSYPQAPQFDNKAYSFTSTYHDGTLKIYTSHATAPKTAGAPPQFDNTAHSFTSTYHDGQLKMYTSHATAPKTTGGPPQYHMSQLRTFAMTDSSKTFREGATHYRNARDLAKEQRDSFIRQANQAARQAPISKRSGRSRSRTSTNTMSMRTTSQSEEHEDTPDTDTSTDELSLDKVFKRSRRAIVADEEQDATDFPTTP